MRNLNKVKILYSLLLVLTVSSSIFTQTKKNIPKQNKIERQVTVTHRKGYLLTGVFSSASFTGIKVIADKQVFNFKWDEISNISFMDVPSTQTTVKKSTSIKKSPAVESALKALRKLESATEIGLNQQEYSRRIIDANIEINELLPEINNLYVKDEIKNAISYHKLASSYWNSYITADSTYRDSKWEFDRKLQGYWAKARKHLENATRGEAEK